MSDKPTRANALDHVVVVLFENRSLDNMLGRLYGPEDGKTFEGVIGKDLSNPIPEWAEHGADRKVVPYGVATDMDSPNPDSGEEYYHTNTQLFNTIDEHNRFKVGAGITAPWNAPPAGATPTMDGFVTDYISTFTGEMGRQPTYEEYAHIMTGFTPEQVPVLSGIAREFGVFDHWFCEVPSQTFMNRSFWTAATSSGLAVNSPVRKWFTENDTETIFERLEAHGKTWKVYVMEPMPVAFVGMIHYSRLKDRLATHFVRFSEFEKDAAAGTLPDFAFIEPNMVSGHGDYHPAIGHAMGPALDVALDSPSSILSGEAFLERVYNAYRSATSETGSNVWNTTLLIGWDEPGGTYDHVPPGAVPPPDPAAPEGEFGFTFDRSGYRVPAILVSPWIEPGSVFNEEYRHTSLIATLRKEWDLGDPLTGRDAIARTFEGAFTLDTPRDPQTWPDFTAQPVPAWTLDPEVLGQTLSGLGKAAIPGMIAHAKEAGVHLPPGVGDTDADLPPAVLLQALRDICLHYFPALADGALPHDEQG
ncbi:alkaline phosphatase family protein (plasmid) [Coraliomargarita sp. W4R53]